MRMLLTRFCLILSLGVSSVYAAADSKAQTCVTPEPPCPIPPHVLVYDCIEKGSDNCTGPYKKECAQGILVETQYDHPFECSDGTPYISEDSGCCDGAIYSKSWEGCCNGETYLLAYDTCCNGQIVPRAACCNNCVIDPDTTGCCQGKTYDKRTHACCAGEIMCGISQIRLKPKECDNCVARAPSCFYATINGSKTMYVARPCGDEAVIVFPEAICPDVKLQVCHHPCCGESPVITGNPKDGYVLEGVCSW